MNLLFSQFDLDTMRRDLYGPGAEIAFYRITPDAGEVEFARLTSGWHATRMQRAMRIKSGFPPGAVSLHLAPTVNLAIDDLRENAVMDLIMGGLTRRYKVVELTETQQIGGGWAVVIEPIEGTV